VVAKLIQPFLFLDNHNHMKDELKQPSPVPVGRAVPASGTAEAWHNAVKIPERLLKIQKIPERLLKIQKAERNVVEAAIAWALSSTRSSDDVLLEAVNKLLKLRKNA
jgi:hypothetical protein